MQEPLIDDIRFAVIRFSSDKNYDNSVNLLNVLGYYSDRTISLEYDNPVHFINFFDGYRELNREKLLLPQWKKATLIFQYTDEEIEPLLPKSEFDKIDYSTFHSYLFFCIELRGDHYSDSKLKTISLNFNRIFKSPCFIIFKYGEKLSLSICDRRVNKLNKDKDVITGVHLIKDVFIDKPRDEQIYELNKLALPVILRTKPVTNFIDIHDTWVSLFDLNNEILEYDENEFLEDANYLFDIGRVREAAEYYSSAIELNETLEEAYINRAKCFLQLDEIDNAKDDMEKVLSINPKNQDALNLWGIYGLDEYEKE